VQVGSTDFENGIRHKTICGEESDAPRDVASSWREQQLKDVIKKYSPNDVYNADETALFYKFMPNKTLAFKGERCTGGKNSKERITILLCTNSTGTDKLLPLVIGKYRSQQCFKNVHNLPSKYHHNAYSWKMSEVFQQ
jgi:hypothetical protein